MVLVSRNVLKQICKYAKILFLHLYTLHMMLKGINRSTTLLVYGRKSTSTRLRFAMRHAEKRNAASITAD
ncbi:hypothetical protein COCVIDRAFT_84128 [Bipolaris victoriae FI3]|uniref:Uncharacterized protein n=1 Tax=Bipolaris victoriae (strain FI3) TaxID=930091 RepID=W7FAT8_BIPV3|nr:hypothetical protein COCVIDRAFT_84128 [Bipolaris victoriae FI3]